MLDITDELLRDYVAGKFSEDLKLRGQELCSEILRLREISNHAPAFAGCCGATDSPAPTMAAVLAMPTAAALARLTEAAAGIGTSLEAIAGHMASMRAVSGMPSGAQLASWQPVCAAEGCETVGAPADAAMHTSTSALATAPSPSSAPARENVSARITADGTVADAAGPTGAPRRRNLAVRPTQSDLVDTLVGETRTHGKQAAAVLFERMTDKYNLTQIEGAAIVRRVRAELSRYGGAGEPQIP